MKTPIWCRLKSPDCNRVGSIHLSVDLNRVSLDKESTGGAAE